MCCVGKWWDGEVSGVLGEEIEEGDDGGGRMILQIATVRCCQVPEVLVGECCHQWKRFGKGLWGTVSRW